MGTSPAAQEKEPQHLNSEIIHCVLRCWTVLVYIQKFWSKWHFSPVHYRSQTQQCISVSLFLRLFPIHEFRSIFFAAYLICYLARVVLFVHGIIFPNKRSDLYQWQIMALWGSVILFMLLNTSFYSVKSQTTSTVYLSHVDRKKHQELCSSKISQTSFISGH